MALISRKIGERNADNKERAAASKNDDADTGKGKCKGTDTVKAKSKAKSKASTGSVRPYYCIERSRRAVQCRTGLKGPGQNQKFPFGEEGEAAAVLKAKKRVRDKLAELEK